MNKAVMTGHNIIAIGASAGGVESLSKLVAELPADLPAAVFVVLHISPHATSALPEILTRAGALKAVHGSHGEAIQPGRIYVAPPDRHLLLELGYIKVVPGPRENGHRPAIDPLFRSAARAYGTQAIGVVLSGLLDDGTAGLWAIKQRGGIALVQNPQEALFDSMPRSAIETVEVDEILTLSEIAAAIARLARTPAQEIEPAPVSDKIRWGTDMAELDNAALEDSNRPGNPSGLACPDCGGVLWQLEEGNLFRFRCRVGHAFSGNSLLAHQSTALEESLWMALRALEELADLNHRMAKRALKGDRHIMANRYQEQAHDAKQRANIIRETLLLGINAEAEKNCPEKSESDRAG